ncbi:MAG: hypothetical protein J0H98_02150 [Solirubrobacterales bacterium]|nr:hypothetical protein [Solirubrobacterales bacterium]
MNFRIAALVAALLSVLLFAAPAAAEDAIFPIAPGQEDSQALPSPEADAGISARVPYRLVGRNWPVRTIRVLNRGRGYTGKVIRTAIRHWNRSGARLKFRLVHKPGSRVVEVRTDKKLNGGRATAGYVRRGEVIPYPGNHPCKVRGSLSAIKKKCPWVKLVRMKRPGGIVWLQKMGKARVPEYFQTQVFVAVHELGHILGLGHRDTTCLVMNTKPRPGCSYSPRNAVKAMCQMPMPGDVLGAVRRYGGRVEVRKPKHNLCDKFPKPGRPKLAIAAEGDGLLGLYVRTGYLAPPHKKSESAGRITIMVTPKSPCPYRRGGAVDPVVPGSYSLDSFWLSWKARKGKKIGRIVAHPAASFPGATLCVAAFVDDRFARRSRLSNPVTLKLRG